MRTTRIFVDVDQTVVDTCLAPNGFFQYLLEHCLNFNFRDFNTDKSCKSLSYDMKKYFAFDACFDSHSFWTQKNLYDKIDPFSSAVEVLKKLNQYYGYQIVMLTAGDDSGSKKAWCYKHFPFIESYVETNEKYLLPQEGDYIIDDRLEHLNKCKSGNKICIDSAYDQGAIPILASDANDDVFFAKDWYEILAHIMDVDPLVAKFIVAEKEES